MRAVFRPYGSDDIRRALLAPVPLLLALLFALVLAACSSADSVDRSVAASDPDQKPRTQVAVSGAGEATVGVAAPARGRAGARATRRTRCSRSGTGRTKGTNGWSWISAPAIDSRRRFLSGPS